MTPTKDEPHQQAELANISTSATTTENRMTPAFSVSGLVRCETPSEQLFMIQQFNQAVADSYSIQLMQPINGGTISTPFSGAVPETRVNLAPPAQKSHLHIDPDYGSQSMSTLPPTSALLDRPPTPPNPADVNGEFVIPSVIPEFYVTETLRGNKAVVYKYFLYFCEDGKKEQKYHHFRCNAPGCKARLTTYGWDSVRAASGEHHHPAPNDLPERMIRQFIKRKAVSSDEPSTAVVANALKNCPPSLHPTMPAHNKLVKLAQVERKRKGNKPSDPKNYKELLLDDKLKLTEKGEMFLLHDDGPEVDGRILCYATHSNLNQLVYCKTWLADASFPSCPRIYTCLFVIFGVINQQLLPLCYFLLPNASPETYTRALQILKMAAPEAAPHVVIVDYDPAQKLAFQEVFAPTLQTCFFYFRQAVLRKLGQLPNLKAFIQQDMTNWNRMKVGRFVALALLRQEDVLIAYRLLLEDSFSQQHMVVLQPMFEYFHAHWINEINENQLNPLSPTFSWNFFQDATKGGLKVSASLDAWHSSFFRYMKGSGPTFGPFFVGLKFQQSKAENLLVELSSTYEPPKKKRMLVDWAASVDGILTNKYAVENVMHHLEQLAMALNLQL